MLELPFGAAADLTALRRQLVEQPGDPAAASHYVRQALRHYAVTGDARFLGYAAGALEHWRNDAAPPHPVWLLRGRILQTRHRFAESAADLERLLRRYPGDPEALLLAADTRRRAGDIDRARSHCAALETAGQADLARFCASDIWLSLGRPARALEVARLATRMQRGGSADATRWTLTLLADAAAAAGRLHLAESSYRQALALPHPGIALHVAYADLLLRAGRPREALEALADLPEADAVLLRRAMAAHALDLPALDEYRARLVQRFRNEEMLGGDLLHQRERAMFELYVRGDAEAALHYARQNWRVQKGPEDAAILIESARAADRWEAAQAVFEWRRHFMPEHG